MLTKKLEPFLLLTLFAITIGAGYLIMKSADTTDTSITTPETIAPQVISSPAKNKPLNRTLPAKRQVTSVNQLPAGAIPNERIIRFDNDDDYQKFLASLKDRGLKLLGSSDFLRAARIGLTSGSNLEGLEGALLAYNYLVTPPTPPDVGAQDGAVGFGRNALAWLGVTGDNSSWGQGITVAVIDSGVNNHPGLSGGNGAISFLPLTELGNGLTQNGHGTAVASIISGDFAQTPGISPAADILSIRVTDENGSSDSFTLAEGIIQAALAGADIINISMGSAANSIVVAEAVEFALAQGAVIVASSGNSGSSTASYPARNEGVISVGAIEAQGEHLDFSSSDPNLDIVAPGFQVNAAWDDDQVIAFTGTSASAPYVSGAIAATMSENPELSATEAANIVLSHTNDGGLPGPDNDHGGGILALDRIMDRNTPGIYDAAIAGQVITQDGSSSVALITIQNQGTEILINSPVVINSPSGIQHNNISSLLPGQIHTFSIPVQLPSDGNPITITSSVDTSEADKDPANNSKTVEFGNTDTAE